MNESAGKFETKKILLVLLPFWTPLIPPTGISCLKGFLQKHGCHVKGVDASMEPELKEFSNRYFNSLKSHVAENKQGNFYSIVNDVLRNHMMAHMNYKHEQEYLDLTTVKTLDLWDFDLQRYPYLVSYTSRSCPFQCSFCSEKVQWGRYRKKTPLQIVNELKELRDRHGSQLFLLSDSLLNPVMQGIARELIKSKESIYWEGWLRADQAVGDIRNTQLWRQAGFYHARIGAESGSPRILKLMAKKITPKQIKNALFSLSQIGIKTSTLWIIGYPGETQEDFQQTLALIEELKDTIYEAEGTPFWYFLTGQSNSDEWAGKYKPKLLYPREAKDMLIAQTWILDCEPGREETYKRLSRFTQHLSRLGIRNIYSLRDIYDADERWKKLHKNAVPELMAFKSQEQYIDENQRVKTVSFARNTLNDQKNMDFAF